MLRVKLQHSKTTHLLTLDCEKGQDVYSQLQQAVYDATGVLHRQQKLISSGKLLTAASLSAQPLKDGCKILLMAGGVNTQVQTITVSFWVPSVFIPDLLVDRSRAFEHLLRDKPAHSLNMFRRRGCCVRCFTQSEIANMDLVIRVLCFQCMANLQRVTQKLAAVATKEVCRLK